MYSWSSLEAALLDASHDNSTIIKDKAELAQPRRTVDRPLDTLD
jgi:hypothetical protein